MNIITLVIIGRLVDKSIEEGGFSSCSIFTFQLASRESFLMVSSSFTSEANFVAEVLSHGQSGHHNLGPRHADNMIRKDLYETFSVTDSLQPAANCAARSDLVSTELHPPTECRAPQVWNHLLQMLPVGYFSTFKGHRITSILRSGFGREAEKERNSPKKNRVNTMPSDIGLRPKRLETDGVTEASRLAMKLRITNLRHLILVLTFGAVLIWPPAPIEARVLVGAKPRTDAGPHDCLLSFRDRISQTQACWRLIRLSLEGWQVDLDTVPLIQGLVAQVASGVMRPEKARRESLAQYTVSRDDNATCTFFKSVMSCFNVFRLPYLIKLYS
ncbi:unnamed protein product [Protopolystoma xenopodis]|uniref:Uncharacterized protein n=1 Tax=Protopolystoma xenopodis TaxID=117903 RepID=A0A3S5AVT9_9PLAT|nr:unnamed protein product [Protopolystoma xenopodis]